jgi:hypothetical protein
MSNVTKLSPYRAALAASEAQEEEDRTLNAIIAKVRAMHTLKDDEHRQIGDGLHATIMEEDFCVTLDDEHETVFQIIVRRPGCMPDHQVLEWKRGPWEAAFLGAA